MLLIFVYEKKLDLHALYCLKNSLYPQVSTLFTIEKRPQFYFFTAN